MTTSAVKTESDELAEQEAIIERGIRTFVEVGHALATIRDLRLYRATHRTFDEYCRERWEFSPHYARCQIRAAEVVTMVTEAGVRQDLVPKTERQARALTPLKDDVPTAVAVLKAVGPNATAKAIEARVAEVAPALTLNRDKSLRDEAVLRLQRATRPASAWGIVRQWEREARHVVALAFATAAVWKKLPDAERAAVLPHQQRIMRAVIAAPLRPTDDGEPETLVFPD